MKLIPIRIRRWATCVLLFLLWSLPGCSAVERIPHSITSTTLPVGDYPSLAWITENQIAFVYAPEAYASMSEYELRLFNLDTHEVTSLDFPQDDRCYVTWKRITSRTPNGNLAAIHTCNINETRFEQYWSLWVMEMTDHSWTRVIEYEENYQPRSYTFAPDMQAWIQYEDKSGGIHGTLTYFTTEGDSYPVFAEFSRTSDPAWSHDGERIAFFGNQGLQRMHEATALRLPWKLYLTDPDAHSAEEILSGVRYGGDLKWSPDDQYLAFSGIYKGEKGIFIMDVADESVYQVWDFDGAFDWSPDGAQMVVLEPVDKNTETTLTETNVYIITLALPEE